MAKSIKLVATLLSEIPAATEISLTLPENLSFEDWRNIAAQLGHARTRLDWLIGDWWAFGWTRYGERKQMVEHWGGLSFQACEDLAWVTRRFETSRRREALSFNHHREVASLEPEEADRLLDWCLEGVPENRARRSTWELRLRVRQLQAEKAEKTAQRVVVSVSVQDVPDVTAVVKLVPSSQVSHLMPPQRPVLDQSPGGGPVPPELANLKVKVQPPPEFDRVAIIKAAYAELSLEERFGLVNDLAAELGYALISLSVDDANVAPR